MKFYEVNSVADWLKYKRATRMSAQDYRAFSYTVRYMRKELREEAPMLSAWKANLPKTRKPTWHKRENFVYLTWFNGYTGERVENPVKRDLVRSIGYIRRQNRLCSAQYYIYNGVRTEKWESGAILELQRKHRDRLIELDKKPKDSKRYVGIEIEFISPDEHDSIEHALKEAGLAPYVQLGTDGSVKGENSDDHDCYDHGCRDDCECMYCGDYACSLIECNCEAEFDENGDLVGEDYCKGHACQGHDDYDCSCECTYEGDAGYELRVLTPQFELASILAKVCKTLQDCNATVNKTCGLHVHLDMRGRDAKKAYNNLYKSQWLLFSMQPKSRRENNYCRPNIESELHEEIETGVRYKCVNAQSYSEHRTLEVRVHSGSISANKIIGWASLLIDIINAPWLPTKIDGYAQLTREVRLRAVSRDYVQQRLLKFAGSDRKLEKLTFSRAA